MKGLSCVQREAFGRALKSASNEILIIHQLCSCNVKFKYFITLIRVQHAALSHSCTTTSVFHVKMHHILICGIKVVLTEFRNKISQFD